MGASRRHSSLTWLSLRIPEGVYHSGILPSNNWDPALSQLWGYLPFTRYAAPDALNSAKTRSRTQEPLFTGTYGYIDSNQLPIGYNARSLVAADFIYVVLLALTRLTLLLWFPSLLGEGVRGRGGRPALRSARVRAPGWPPGCDWPHATSSGCSRRSFSRCLPPAPAGRQSRG